MYSQRKLISSVLVFLFLFQYGGFFEAGYSGLNVVYGASAKPVKANVSYTGQNIVEYPDAIKLSAQVVQSGGKAKKVRPKTVFLLQK